MTLDLTKMKPNAFIRMRNGEFYTVTKVKNTISKFNGNPIICVEYGDGYLCDYNINGNMDSTPHECDIVDYVNLPEGEGAMSLLHAIMKLKNFSVNNITD